MIDPCCGLRCMPSQKNVAISIATISVLVSLVLAGYAFGFDKISAWMAQRSVEVLGQTVTNGIWVALGATGLAVGSASIAITKCCCSGPVGRLERRIPRPD